LANWSLGGYTSASKEIVTLLRQKSRPYLFSNALPPSVVASAQKVFDLLASSTAGPQLRSNLLQRTHQFRRGMTDAGFTILGHPDHPIAPVWLGEAKLASDFAERMLQEGVYVVGFSYPVVPKGKARIRVQLSGAHTKDQVDFVINKFTKVGKELKVI
jgi:glycine C-acetyltransferase